MDKLRLTLEELDVQSFETTAAGAARRGTVRGNDSLLVGEDVRVTGEATCGASDDARTCPPMESWEVTCPEQWSCPCNSLGCTPGTGYGVE